MKRIIKWHKECLKAREENLIRDQAEFERIQKRLERSRQIAALYKAQIELAEKEGKDGFDADKYAIKRLCI